MLTPAQQRALQWLCVAILAFFWVQALWDLAHPPVYESPWGPLGADATQPPSLPEPP